MAKITYKQRKELAEKYDCEICQDNGGWYEPCGITAKALYKRCSCKDSNFSMESRKAISEWERLQIKYQKLLAFVKSIECSHCYLDVDAKELLTEIGETQ